MSSGRELLALRREALVARGAVQRARAASELTALRKGLSLPRAAAAVAASAQGRSALLASLLFLTRGTRLARVARTAIAVVAVVQVARAFVRAREQAAAGTLRH